MVEHYNGAVGIVFFGRNPRKFLLVRNKKTNDLDFPQGLRQVGELFSENTVKRELYEKTGLLASEYTIRKLNFTHEFTYQEKKAFRGGQKGTLIIYLVDAKKTAIMSKDQESKIEGWFTAEEIMNKLSSSDSKDLFLKATKEMFL